MINNLNCYGCDKLADKSEFFIKKINNGIQQNRFICSRCDAWMVFSMEDKLTFVSYKIDDILFNMDYINNKCYIIVGYIIVDNNDVIYIEKDFIKNKINMNSAKRIIKNYINIL